MRKKVSAGLLILFLFFRFSFSQEVTAPDSGAVAVPKTALVLSGGGARGLAHLGVIRALEEIGFYPDLIVGTSMGAIIGGLYACGYDAGEIYALFQSMKWERLLSYHPYRHLEMVSTKLEELPTFFSLRFDEHFNVIFPRNLVSTQALQEELCRLTLAAEYYAAGDFDSLVIPFRAVTTDIRQGKMVVLSRGYLARAIAASSAFPIVLAPVRVDSLLLVDGGVTNNVPCDVAKALGADFIVAVDITSKIVSLEQNVNTFDIMGQTINTISYFSDTRNLELADVLIHPEMPHITSVDFDSLESLVQIGYRETQKYIEKISAYGGRTHPDPDFLFNASQALEKTRINKINFQNNRQTRPYVIRRELRIRPGDQWDWKKVLGSFRNLLSTRLFQNVYFSLQQTGENLADLTVEVVEEEQTLFAFGARYDTEREARALVTFKHLNTLGTGIDNYLYAILSNQFRKIGWQISSPRIFTTTLTNNLHFFHQIEDIPLYQSGRQWSFGQFTRTGLGASLGIQVLRVGMTSIGFDYERVRIEENPDFQPLISKEDYGVGSVILRVLVDDTDDYDLPTRGRQSDIYWQHSISAEERKNFDRIGVQSSYYYSFLNRHTLSTQLNLGYLSTDLSFFERFRLGGVNSLPGYHRDELWGRFMLTAGASIRVQFRTSLYLRTGLVIGNIWPEIGDFQWRDFKIGWRLGGLIQTPFGPISLDYGWNFKDRALFYFSVGHQF